MIDEGKALNHLYDEKYVKKQLNEFKALYKEFARNPSSYKRISATRLIPIQASLDQHAESVDCRKGCSYCCNYRVEAYSYEIIALYYHIQAQFKTDLKEQLLSRIQEAANKIAPLDPVSHYKTNIQCPMLLDGVCSVYAVRPMACAAFYSSNSSTCEYQYNNPDDLVTAAAGIPQLNLDTQLEKDIAGFGLDRAKHDNVQYELVTSLLALFDAPSLIKRWKKGRAIFHNRTPG